MTLAGLSAAPMMSLGPAIKSQKIHALCVLELILKRIYSI